MIGLNITPNLDNAPWADLEAEGQTRNIEGQLERIGLMPNGTGAGHPVVWFQARDAYGNNVVVQTTWRLFNTAHAAMRAANEHDCARAEA